MLSLTLVVLVRFGHDHLLIVGEEYALYASHYLRGVWRVHLWHDYAYCVGASCLEVQCHRIATIAKPICLVQHSLSRFATYVFVVGKRP